MSDPHVTDSPRALPVVACSDLLAAETTLKALTDLMHAEYVASDNKWPRDWMQNHVNERAAIIKVRNILISRAEAANDKVSDAPDSAAPNRE